MHLLSDLKRFSTHTLLMELEDLTDPVGFGAALGVKLEKLEILKKENPASKS